jgi:hypothetical protein
MKHRKFVVTSTVIMFLLTGVVAGLALYSTVVARASNPGLPVAVGYLPMNSQAVFGMNVQKFIASPVYARFQARQGEQVGKDLQDFIDKTGVDPRKDISYIIAAGRSLDGKKGTGVVIAQGTFNTAAITTFISTQVTPIRVDYPGAVVLMIPEKDGSSVDKGIAFMSENEIAVGEITALKEVLDVRRGVEKGVYENPTLGPLISKLNPNEMFWFAGDPTNVLSKAPANTPLGGNITAIVNVFGTLNLTTEVAGTITVTAKDVVSAGKLADVAKGLLALGSLASDQNPDLAQLLSGVRIEQIQNADTSANDQIRLRINFPIELLDKLQNMKPAAATAKKVA